ncbi:hypothetical protein PENSPDRAFT_647879 [Peniophora sp. CONT]|nr:hypothetical protein PENSPDRAFT_647879 [Peniophora sp. CONT]
MVHTNKTCDNSGALVPYKCTLQLNSKCPHHLCCPCCVEMSLKNPNGVLCHQSSHKSNREKAYAAQLKAKALAKLTDAVAAAALGDASEPADLSPLPIIPRTSAADSGPGLAGPSVPPKPIIVNSPLDPAWHIAAAGSGIAAEFDRQDAKPRVDTLKRALYVATKEAGHTRTVGGKIWLTPSEPPKNLMLSVDEVSGFFFPAHFSPLVSCLKGNDVFEYYDPHCTPEADWVIVSTSRPIDLSSKMAMVLFRVHNESSPSVTDAEYKNFSTLVIFACSRQVASTQALKRPMNSTAAQSPMKRRASSVIPSVEAVSRTASTSSAQPSPLGHFDGEHTPDDVDIAVNPREPPQVTPARDVLGTCSSAMDNAPSTSIGLGSSKLAADTPPYADVFPVASGVLLPPLTKANAPTDFPSDWLYDDIFKSAQFYCMLRSACKLSVKVAGAEAFPCYDIAKTNGGAMRALLKKFERSSPALRDAFLELGRDEVATFGAFDTCRKTLTLGTTSLLPWPRNEKDADMHFEYTPPPAHILPKYKYRRAYGTYVRILDEAPTNASTPSPLPTPAPASTPASPRSASAITPTGDVSPGPVAAAAETSTPNSAEHVSTESPSTTAATVAYAQDSSPVIPEMTTGGGNLGALPTGPIDDQLLRDIMAAMEGGGASSAPGFIGGDPSGALGMSTLNLGEPLSSGWLDGSATAPDTVSGWLDGSATAPDTVSGWSYPFPPSSSTASSADNAFSIIDTTSDLTTFHDTMDWTSSLPFDDSHITQPASEHSQYTYSSF